MDNAKYFFMYRRYLSHMQFICFAQVYIDWPGSPLRLPQSLLDTVQLIEYESGKVSPYYGDPVLLNALQQFITALGARYDGDRRIYLLHLGLLGFWGEVSCSARLGLA